MTIDCAINQENGFIMKLIHLVHRFEHAADTCFFAPHGLSMSTGRILMCLYHGGEQTPTELTHLIGGKKSNMTQRISMLKKAGYVALKEGVSGDRRRVYLELTEKGRHVAEQMDQVFHVHIHQLEDGLTKEQKDAMAAVLDSLNEKLNLLDCHHA